MLSSAYNTGDVLGERRERREELVESVWRKLSSLSPLQAERLDSLYSPLLLSSLSKQDLSSLVEFELEKKDNLSHFHSPFNSPSQQQQQQPLRFKLLFPTEKSDLEYEGQYLLNKNVLHIEWCKKKKSLQDLEKDLLTILSY